MPRIPRTTPADGRTGDPIDDWVWRRAVADGHLHRAAVDCPHRPPAEACRVCCPHDDDDIRVDLIALDDEVVDDFSPALAVLCGVLAFLFVAAVVYGGIFACAAIAS